MGEGFFHRINRITGKLPLAGNVPTRQLIRDGIFNEPRLEKRQKRVYFALAFTAFMVFAHVMQAGIGIKGAQKYLEDIRYEYLNRDSIDTKSWSNEMSAAFLFLYALVNVMVSISQAYLAYRVVSDTKQLKRRREHAFFQEVGMDQGSSADPGKLAAYVLAAAQGDAKKQDLLRAIVGESKVNDLAEAARSTSGWDKVISREDFAAALQKVFHNTTPVFPLKVPVKEGITIREAVAAVTTIAAQGVCSVVI